MPIYFKLRGKSERNFPTPHHTDERSSRLHCSGKDTYGFKRILNVRSSNNATVLAEIRSSGPPDDDSVELTEPLPRDAIKVSTRMEQSVHREMNGFISKPENVELGL